MKKSKFTSIIICILVFSLFILIAIQKLKISFSKEKFTIFIQEFLSLKIKKKVLVDYYQVDKATFKKWIEIFCQEIFPSPETYKNKRTLTLAETISINFILGNVEENKVLSKREIFTKGEGNYRSLRESINQFPEHFDITTEAYDKLRLFPPKIARKILDQYS